MAATRRGDGSVHSLTRLALSLALRVLPRRRHIVVFGWGDDEGNALEVLRYLSGHYSGTAYWLVDRHPTAALLERLAPLAGPPPRLVRRRSVHALLLFLLAEAVFHTHGVFTSPYPGRRKTHVNLWHGDGPKRMDNVSHSITGSFSYLVSGTQRWGEEKQRYFGAPASRLLVVGNPRIDQFDRPASDASLHALGLDPTRPLVVWMPTFRSATVDGSQLWTDSPSLLGHQEVRGGLAGVLRAAEAAGVSFVVKPHRLDADAFGELGVPVVTSDALQAAGCSVYQLLARTVGLVTDYSSVWTDYLTLDRPILLFCPDLGEYEKVRAFTVDSLDQVAPGPLVTTVEGLTHFVSSIGSGSDGSATRRHAVAEALGAVTETGATARLFAALCDRDALCVDPR